jgi:hypothetical protein
VAGPALPVPLRSSALLLRNDTRGNYQVIQTGD